MREEKVSTNYTSHGSLNFMSSRKILKVAEMIEQAKKSSREPVVRKMAYEVMKNVHDEPLDIKRMSDADRNKVAEAIFLWVRDNIEYINDPPGDHFPPAIETLEVKAGDCDDQAILLAAMLGSIGFEPIFVILPEHVYIELQQSTGESVPMDPTLKNTVFGELPKGMRDYLEERYGLAFEDYLRVPIGRHITVTPAKEVVETTKPLQAAIHNEKNGAISYNKQDYRAAKHYFLAAAKMYHAAALHTDLKDVREGLFISSQFCKGWSHLSQMIHLILCHNNDHLSLLQSEINQARSLFKASMLFFEKIGNDDIAQEIDAVSTILGAYDETLLADLLQYTKDDDASLRHYKKAIKLYEEAKDKTDFDGLVDYIDWSLDGLSNYIEDTSRESKASTDDEKRRSTSKTDAEIDAVISVHPTADADLSARFDISVEDLATIKDRLTGLRGEDLRREFMRLSIEKRIATNILEVIYSQIVGVSLRADYPDTGDRYGNIVRIHPEVMDQLGLRKIDRVRIVSSNREGIVTVQNLNTGENKDIIKVNKPIRDVLGINIGDMVKIERVYLK